MMDSAENSDVYHYSQEVYAQQVCIFQPYLNIHFKFLNGPNLKNKKISKSQVYSNYQDQPLGSQYVSYSVNDEKFIDGDEALR